jgi:SanA protein
LGVIIVLAGLGVLIPNLVITRSAAAHIVSDPADAPEAEVAIVLGARVYSNGGLSPMLTDRLATGVQLYKLGKVKKLLLSGDHGQVTYDEVNAMLRYAVDHGVPDEDVFTDHAGFSTYDTMYRARDVFKVTTALVVTQGFHLARAVYTARRLGLEATGVVADIQPYSSELRFAMRDWLARIKAFLDLNITKPEPRYLGPAIPIDGDGRATRG